MGGTSGGGGHIDEPKGLIIWACRRCIYEIKAGEGTVPKCPNGHGYMDPMMTLSKKDLENREQGKPAI